MHTSKDDNMINTLRFVSLKESTHIYGATLPECLTSPEMKERKEIELLSDVALTEEARMKEITPTITSEGTGDKSGVPDETKDDSTESKSESWGNDEDDSNNEP
ncbi:hypothetical protein Tco_0622984 [Tanacetum coccineum]